MMKGAFTLIEMLVVLAIITTLAAIMIPLLAGTQKFIDEESNNNLMTMVSNGLDIYFADFDQYPLQSDWLPGKADGVYQTPDGGIFTETNNLGKQLAAITPTKPSNAVELEQMRFLSGYECKILLGDLPKEISSQFDYSQKNIPINDYYGNPLIYIYNPLGVFSTDDGGKWIGGRGRFDIDTAAMADGKEAKEYSAFKYATSKYRIRYQLWSRGEDGLFDERLYDETLEINEDNIRGVE